MDLDETDIFLGHDWLVKHNPEVNWKNGIIKSHIYSTRRNSKNYQKGANGVTK